MGAIERGERNLTLKSVERIVGRLDLDPLALLAESIETEDDKSLDRLPRSPRPNV
jgi:hypothetical protein